VLQGALEYALKYDDPHQAGEAYGSSDLTVSLYVSPGGLTGNNTNEQFELARQGAKADYAYLHVSADRVTPLFGPLSWYVGGQAQFATGALLSDQKMWLGGLDTIRGYDENSAGGDSGGLLRNELRFDLLNGDRGLIPANGTFGGILANQQIQLYGFWDIGVVNDAVEEFGTPDSTTLDSLGLGFRYWFLNNISLQGDYGWQLKALPGQSTGARGDILVVVSY
jgi:hemolysin activation/secretion protein